MGHPFDEFEYIVTHTEEKANEPDKSSKVKGLFKRIEEAASTLNDLRCNQTVMFAGMICPVICEEESRVQIQHGNIKMWLPRETTSRVLSGRKKEKQDRWMHIFVSPLPKDEKE